LAPLLTKASANTRFKVIEKNCYQMRIALQQNMDMIVHQLKCVQFHFFIVQVGTQGHHVHTKHKVFTLPENYTGCIITRCTQVP
jgi:hypothetical protein